MSILPQSWQQKLREEQPDPSKWNKELSVLFDASIEARPLQLPSMMDIQLKDSSFVPYWVRRKLGPNPDTTRYMQMRAAGYENVTLDDIVSPDKLTAAISADKSEITCGVDLVLMKAKKEIHYGAMKFHQERALQMTSPRKGKAQDSIMRSVPLASSERNALDGSNSSTLSESQSEAFRSKAVYGITEHDNAIRKGTPEWDKIVEEAKGKKEK